MDPRINSSQARQLPRVRWFLSPIMWGSTGHWLENVLASYPGTDSPQDFVVYVWRRPEEVKTAMNRSFHSFGDQVAGLVSFLELCNNSREVFTPTDPEYSRPCTTPDLQDDGVRTGW
jgi:hypothetical protein